MINILNEVFDAGMLTGLEIEKRVKNKDIEIEPYDPSRLNPNSYNLRLDKQLKIYKPCENLDSHTDNETISFEIPEEGYVLQPGVLYIGRTIERTKSDKFIPMINGRSSGGRLGLSVHICAGFGDIGFDGTWTLEITVVHPLKIYAGDEVAQVCYFTPYGDYRYKYNGRYQGQIEATPSRFYSNKEKKSLAEHYILDMNADDIAYSLREKYGPQEFFNNGIDLNNAIISKELMSDEFIECSEYDSRIEFIFKYKRDVDGNVIDIERKIGKVYELNGERIYVRKGYYV